MNKRMKKPTPKRPPKRRKKKPLLATLGGKYTNVIKAGKCKQTAQRTFHWSVTRPQTKLNAAARRAGQKSGNMAP